MDIKLYKSNGNFVTPLDTEFDSEQMDDSVLSDTPSSDIETIAGRVVKFLLTNIGTDLFDSEYVEVDSYNVAERSFYIGFTADF